MRDLFEKLVKILRLEQSRNYDNSAVIGGLEGFLAFWISEARLQASSPADRRKVEAVAESLVEYGSFTPGERKARVRFVMERLGFVAPPPPPSSTPRTEGSSARAPAGDRVSTPP